MGKEKNQPSVSVESLIRLKRCEKPSENFWNDFDRDFQRRRLNALVETSSSFHMPGSLLRWVSLALPAVCLGIFGTFWMNHHIPVSAQPAGFAEAAAPTVSIGSESSELRLAEEDVPASRETMLVTDARLSEPLRSRFVVDAFNGSDHGQAFRKVMYTPALRMSTSASSLYVNDSVGDLRQRVLTSAEMRINRNF
jgi:hypothetical protein